MGNITCTAAMESPPSAKKSSPGVTVTPRTSVQAFTSISRMDARLGTETAEPICDHLTCRIVLDLIASRHRSQFRCDYIDMWWPNYREMRASDHLFPKFSFGVI